VEHDDGTHGDDGSGDVMLSKEVTSRMLATMLVEVKGGWWWWWRLLWS
jgi:hypothetical protein